MCGDLEKNQENNASVTAPDSSMCKWIANSEL